MIGKGIYMRPGYLGKWLEFWVFTNSEFALLKAKQKCRDPVVMKRPSIRQSFQSHTNPQEMIEEEQQWEE